MQMNTDERLVFLGAINGNTRSSLEKVTATNASKAHRHNGDNLRWHHNATNRKEALRKEGGVAVGNIPMY
jgi:hypothetical protein